MTKFMKDLTVYLLALHIKRVKHATFFASPKQKVKITEIGTYQKRARSLYFKVTLGALSYAEKKFAKKCLRAGEPFPVKKVQLKHRKPKAKRKKVKNNSRLLSA